MPWKVEFTDEFERWWNSLSVDEQVEISAKVELLQEHGYVPRPMRRDFAFAPEMKGLRGKVEEKQLRVLYAFDPIRTRYF